MPSLGQVRGRITLATFTGPRGQIYAGYGLNQLTTGDWGRYTENDWTVCDPAAKWARAQANIAEAAADTSSAMYTTYTSANCAPFGAGPAEVAGGDNGYSGVNQRALDHLVSTGLSHVGVVMMDYPGHALIDAILAHSSTPAPMPTAVEIRDATGKCIDVANSDTANGTRIQMWGCNGSNAQKWTFSSDGSIRAIGKCMDVRYGESYDSNIVWLWECNGSAAQQWTRGANGSLRALSRCLDVPNWNEGTQLTIYTCHNGPNQNWTVG